MGSILIKSVDLKQSWGSRDISGRYGSEVSSITGAPVHWASKPHPAEQFDLDE